MGQEFYWCFYRTEFGGCFAGLYPVSGLGAWSEEFSGGGGGGDGEVWDGVN